MLKSEGRFINYENLNTMEKLKEKTFTKDVEEGCNQEKEKTFNNPIDEEMFNQLLQFRG